MEVIHQSLRDDCFDIWRRFLRVYLAMVVVSSLWPFSLAVSVSSINSVFPRASCATRSLEFLSSLLLLIS